MAVGQHGDPAIVLGAGHTPMAMLAGHQPALAVGGVAVGESGGRAKHRHRPVGVVVAQQPVVGQVGPDQIAPAAEPGRALGPAAAGPQALQPRVADEAGGKLGFDDLETATFDFAMVHGCLLVAPRPQGGPVLVRRSRRRLLKADRFLIDRSAACAAAKSVAQPGAPPPLALTTARSRRRAAGHARAGVAGPSAFDGPAAAFTALAISRFDWEA